MPRVPTSTVQTNVINDTIMGETNICILTGHMTTPANLNAGYSLYQPIEVGYVTKISEAIAWCSRIGLTLNLTASYEVDVTTSDKIAVKFYSAVKEIEQFRHSNPEYELDEINFVLGVLEDGVDTKITTPFGSLLTNIYSSQYQYDLITCPYEYTAGDDGIAGNFFDEINTHTQLMLGDATTLSSRFTVLMMNISDDIQVSANFGAVNYENILHIAHPYGTVGITSETIERIVGIQACHIVGMKEPYRGRVNIEFATMPRLPVLGTAANDSSEQALLDLGWSTVRYDTISKRCKQSLILQGGLIDANTGIQREFYTDYQDYIITHLWKKELFQALLEADLINNRYTFNAQGQATISRQAKSVAVKISENFYNDRFFAVPVKTYIDRIVVSADTTGTITVSQPIYTSNFVKSINGFGFIEDSNTIVQTLIARSN